LLTIGLVLWGLIVYVLKQPVWKATGVAVTLLLYPAVLKWKEDLKLWGTPVMILSMSLVLQTFHTFEHIAQVIQYHILGWPLKASSGLISAANSEWIHFAWNWGVLLVLIYLMAIGKMRNVWAWLLLVWASAHTFEHTYLFARYIAAVRDLISQGVSPVFAQGMPGILGREGWLFVNSNDNGPVEFICQVAPALITPIRLDIHFYWNAGEVVLLVLAAHVHLRRLWGKKGMKMEEQGAPPSSGHLPNDFSSPDKQGQVGGAQIRVGAQPQVDIANGLGLAEAEAGGRPVPAQIVVDRAVCPHIQRRRHVAKRTGARHNVQRVVQVGNAKPEQHCPQAARLLNQLIIGSVYLPVSSSRKQIDGHAGKQRLILLTDTIAVDIGPDFPLQGFVWHRGGVWQRKGAHRYQQGNQEKDTEAAHDERSSRRGRRGHGACSLFVDRKCFNDGLQRCFVPNDVILPEWVRSSSDCANRCTYVS
jgi:hypothetical protein